MTDMKQKIKALQDIRDLIVAGKVDDKKHSRLFFEDVNGDTVRLSDPEALDAINARIASMEGGSV